MAFRPFDHLDVNRDMHGVSVGCQHLYITKSLYWCNFWFALLAIKLQYSLPASTHCAFLFFCLSVVCFTVFSSSMYCNILWCLHSKKSSQRWQPLGECAYELVPEFHTPKKLSFSHHNWYWSYVVVLPARTWTKSCLQFKPSLLCAACLCSWSWNSVEEDQSLTLWKVSSSLFEALDFCSQVPGDFHLVYWLLFLFVLFGVCFWF